MDFTNRQVMNKGLDALQGKWPIAIGASFTAFLPMLILGVIEVTISNTVDKPLYLLVLIASSILGTILVLGLSIFTLKIVQNKSIKFDDIFRGFNYYKKVIPIALLFCGLGVINFMLPFIALVSSGVFWLVFFAWLVLYMIIGLMLSQVWFVLIDNPNMRVIDILMTSKNMVNGYKWQLVRLFLIFGVLGVLSLLTLGIGGIWLAPFMFTCLAQFYLELKQRYHPAN